MRHLSRGRRLNRHGSHRTAMMRNQATALFTHGRIKTTVTKAKNLQPYVEKLITTAKGGTLHDRRLVTKEIHSKKVVSKLMDEIAPSLQEHNGGCTRIYKLGLRRGDNAQEALIELVNFEL
jgi:large subunit ribosomal protein L17